jgi:Putative amidoligase enzyme
MKKLHELLNKKPLKGDVGIEIECEGKGFKAIDTAVWTSKDDGSLRGVFPDSRIEFVVNGPIPLDTVKSAVEELVTFTKDATPSFSFRTSVHVHVNVLNMEEEHFKNFIYTYVLLEEALFTYCGNTRKCNRFCLRLQDSDWMTDLFIQIMKKGVDALAGYSEDQIRYGAINLAAVRKYGSVEFRGMRGTLDPEVLNVWVNALVSIRNFACHFKNVQQIHDLFVNKGSKGFLEYVLGPLANHFYTAKVEKEMLRSYSLSLPIPYSYKESVEKKEEPKPLKKINWDIEAFPIPGDVVPGDVVVIQGNRFIPAPRRRAVPRVNIVDDVVPGPEMEL